MSAARHRRACALLVCCAAALAAEALLAPAASASLGGALAPAGFLGLPSLHGIIEAIAGGFFSALAKALVPSWLTHGTVATIQHLVALPDPAEWGHVGELQSETTYLGAMFAPVTLSVAALRYWMLGLTGAAHPASALARCAGATGLLVAYRWIVEQVVAGTNTLTHGLLALPSVSGGLGRIIGVLFGGALLAGGGGVFGALLVIVGVIFAAGLFAAQVLVTVVLAVLIVAGPPLIALAAIPELAHLARAWRDALIAVALVPLGWTVLFATAGALCLDATSFTGGASGLPGHVAAAFAGLITFALAVKLPLMLFGELRHALSRGGLTGGSSAAAAPALPGAERVRSAHARLRAIGLVGAPALGASLGAAAGALGAPAGGPLGAARRRLASAAGRTDTGQRTGSSREPRKAGGGQGHGLGERVLRARAILAQAPREAARAVRDARPSSGHRYEGAGRGRAARSTRPPHEQRPGAGTGQPRAPKPQAAGARSASSSRPRTRVTLAAVEPPAPRTANAARANPAAFAGPPHPAPTRAAGAGEQPPPERGTGARGARERLAAPAAGGRDPAKAGTPAPSRPASKHAARPVDGARRKGAGRRAAPRPGRGKST